MRDLSKSRRSVCQREIYEELFSEQVCAKGARAFALGRQALVILLKALDISDGDRIGICGFTCLSVAEAVKVCGAIPVYLDVDERLCIDPENIMRQKPGSLKVVILQHTFGVPGQLELLLSACKKIGAKVVEDCAHSLGCSWKNKPLGSFGEGAIYSFQWGKPYTTGEGGMLTVNSGELLDKVDRQIEEIALPVMIKSELMLECKRRLYSILCGLQLYNDIKYAYGKLRDVGLVKQSFRLNNQFEFYRGYVRLAGEMTAEAGLKQLENWSKLKQIRQENTELIEDYLNKRQIKLWTKPSEAEVVFLRYPILTSSRSRIIKQAQNRKLDIADWYRSPVHPLQDDDLLKVDYVIGSCSKAENMIAQLIHLPTGLGLNKRNLEDMVKIIHQNYSNTSSK
jgi:perosamine synthetase